MTRKKSITVGDLADIVFDAADALSDSGVALNDDDHEALTKLLAAFLAARGVTLAPEPPEEPMLPCAHGRIGGVMCPHCMSLSGAPPESRTS